MPGGRGVPGGGAGLVGGDPRLIGGGLVPGGRGVLSDGAPGGLVGGDPRLIGGGLVPGGRGVPGIGAGVLGGDPAWIACRLPAEGFTDEVNCWLSSCRVMLAPKSPSARSAMSSPTLRAIASATAFSGAFDGVRVRCSKLARSSFSGTLRMRSSRNRVPERLSIISRAVIGGPSRRHE